MSSSSRRVDECGVVLLALAVRLALTAWAWHRIPPVDDATFYQTFAERLAHGLGYTWRWPDGVVTYAAHYPVGYPAWLALWYRVFGTAPGVAMVLNAVFGTLGVWAVYRLVARAEARAQPRAYTNKTSYDRRGPALLIGVVAALHPTLVAYTPALMTEGVSSAALVLLCLLAVSVQEWRAWRWFGGLALGLGSGLLVLVRPQVLLLAPVLGALAAGSGWARWRWSMGVTALAVFTCLPWTLRNCARLDRCVFVSANGGWNLFIGSAPKATGAWVSLDELGVPVECREVFGEVEKDACFGRAGARNVRSLPFHFLSLIPAKLSQTFDFSFAPGHYLRAANPDAVSWNAMVALGIAEALVQRLVLLLALWAAGKVDGPKPRTRRFLAWFGAAWLFVRWAWVSHVLLVLAVSLLGRDVWRRPTLLFGAAVVAATALTHAIFFGAGRYGLVCVLPLLGMAGSACRDRPGALAFREHESAPG